MIARLLGWAAPYMLYIKLAAAAAVIAGSGYAGWKVRDWQCDAALTGALENQIAQTDERIKDYKRELAVQERFKDEQRSDYHTRKAALEKRLAALEEDLKNATLTPQPSPDRALDPDRPFSREFVRLWNDAIRAANGASADPEARPGVPRADTSTAGVTREDVIAEVKKIAGIYAGCKLKHDKIIEHEKAKE